VAATLQNLIYDADNINTYHYFKPHKVKIPEVKNKE